LFLGGSITHTEKMFFFKNENDMQILQNIYNNMMAYGAMNHCLLFGWRRKFGFFMKFFISIYFFATERGALFLLSPRFALLMSMPSRIVY
jgi:hypothetical protein